MVFIRSLLFGKGFSDGKRGLIRAYMASLYQIIYLSKLYENSLKTSSNAPDILSALLTEIIEEGIKDDASLIHSGRNKIWRKEISGMTIAIKIYGYSPLKSIIYSIRKTKARRAFENARALIARGIATPFPLAFVEKRGFINRLTGSMYISMYEETEPLENILTTVTGLC